MPAPSAVANVLVGTVSVKFSPTGLTDTFLGWTIDGVTMTITSEEVDIKVDDIVGPIKRVLVDQSIEVTLNMAETELADMAKLIPGSIESPAGTIILGGGSPGGSRLQTGPLVMVGLTPTGTARTISLTNVTPTGATAIPYKKDAVSVFPVTFLALANVDGEFGTIVDA